MKPTKWQHLGMTALLLFLATISLLFEATTQTAIASGPTPTPLPPASQHRQWSPDAPQRARNANGVLHVPSDYPTISQALSDAQSGDTVRVAGGSYLEGGLAVPPGVHLVGDGWRNTIIDGGGADVVVYPGPGSLVEGFTIQGSGDGYFNAGVWISHGEAIIRKNHIRDNATGFWAWCFDPTSCAVQATIERNVISGNAFNGINSNDQPRLIIRRNTIVENDAAGVILNNAASLAKNNLIVANVGDGLVNHAGASAGYNNVWGNAQDFIGVAPGPGNLSLDPLFRNAAQGDYRLRAASPVIGMADPPGSDMGALPFQPQGITPPVVTLTQVGGREWKVSWTDSEAAGYYLAYGPCTRQTTTIVDAGASTTYHLSQVEAGGIGYVAVSAYDAQGRESAVRLAEGVQVPCPTAPQQLEAGAFPGGVIRLRWRDTTSLETGFHVERARSPLTPTTYSLVAALPANTTVFTDTPPLLAETYWYRVRAFNDNGPSPFSNHSYSATFDQVPNPDEQYLLVLINEARADPGVFGYPDLDPVPPLAYNPLLNYAAHAHSQAILNAGFRFGHCDLIGRCPSERARAVGYQGGVGENLVQGMTGPAWVEIAHQSFMDSEGHRNNLLSPDLNEAGLGHTYDPNLAGSYWKGQYTETFSGRPSLTVPNLPSGIVVPYAGGENTVFTYTVNYYHPQGLAPVQALVVIDNVAYAMTHASGAPANGAYRYSATLPAQPQHDYYFHFTFPGGQARLPETGSYDYPLMPPTWQIFLPAVHKNQTP